MKTINRIICSLLLASACSIGAIAQENQSYFLHTIEKGQSLYSIASMYGVSQSDIIKLNPGSDEKIFIGRTLRIPRSAANIQKETYHTIETGETLYRLTVKYNVSAKAICDANPGLSAENFRIGQVIRIPSTTETQTMVPAETQSSTVVANNNILGPVESRCRDMHKVKRKETVFSISREYGISEAELIAANPELKGENKIKKGTFLCIPYPKAQTEQNIQSQAIPTDSELFRENRKKTERFSTIKAAVILPFLDGVSKSESSRMVEYYEGLLMAVDSLKRTGTSIDLYTYNSGPESASLNSILGKSEMKDMDIIFGPLYQQHIKPLAEFAKKQETPMATIMFLFNGTCKYDLRNNLTLSILDQALDMVYTAEIREKEGGTYGVSCSGSLTKYPKEQLVLQIVFQTDPAKKDKLSGIVIEQLEKMAKEGPSAEHMQKIKEYMLKKYKDAQKENGYWLGNLDEYFYTGIDYTKDYETLVNSITAKDVQEFLAKLMKQNNEIQVIMTVPEEEAK